MTDERYQKIMADLGMPNSRSLLQALRQVANEVAQETLAAERERCAELCIERAQLSWAAVDQPYAAEVKMQHEAVAVAMEDMAGYLRA